MKFTPEQHIELHGFNNLTKSLSFNMFDICYTRTKEEREAYIEYIDEQYSAERLTKILTHAVGKRVIYLKRISMGPLQLDETLELGEYRELTDEEIALLQNL